MTWLGIDGEGLARQPHRYVQLCVSDSESKRADFVEDANGLSTEAALQFLLRLAGRDVRIAGYYLSYDWTKILSDLPNKLLYRLLRPELRATERGEGGGFLPIHWRGYRLHFLSGMMRIAKGKTSVTVWDVGKFYQARFVAALEQSGIGAPELIRRMKDERGTWEVDDLDRMRDYCLDECRHLARLCAMLERQHEAIGLELSSWYGPGSTASALLKLHNVSECHDRPPSAVQDVAERAYFGGRFEQSTIGTAAGVRSYDIRSAYPHAASSLPCLVHGKWVHRRRAPRSGAVALVSYRLRDIGARAWGPLPCRLDDGSIVWPRGGSSGWAWNVEYQSAREHWRGVEYRGEHWELVKRCDCQPFEFLEELYRWRVSKPENKQVVKLAMNSVYGKLAQSIGGGSKWSSRVWCGIITATTRAQLLDLIALHSDESHLLALATDGAYSTERLPVREGAALGEWEVEDKGAMTFVRPGIYWSLSDVLAWYGAPGDRTVEAAAQKAVRSRGIGRSHLLTQVARSEACIARGDERAELGTTTQFGGARECVYLTRAGVYKRSKLYGEWYEMPATLSLAALPKRNADWSPRMLGGVESAPYEKGVSPEAKKLRLLGSMLEGRIT